MRKEQKMKAIYKKPEIKIISTSSLLLDDSMDMYSTTVDEGFAKSNDFDADEDETLPQQHNVWE